MFSNIGGAEFLLISVFGLLLGLLPIVLLIWAVVTLARIQRRVDRMAAALERLTGVAPRGP